MDEQRKEVAHSPLPWSNGRSYARVILDAERSPIAQCEGLSGMGNEANARFIVRAVNSHAELLAALKGFVEWCEDGALSASDREMFVRQFRAAIAKAEQG